jgi:exoribonuclease R
MTNFTIHILERNYTSWNITPTSLNHLNINPYDNKLFHEDVFNIDKHNNITVVSSPLKSNKIAGVLVLSKNKTYGRQMREDYDSIKHETKYKCVGKTMYKFIPNDHRLPHFLVPYAIKQLGFSKVMHNLYAVIIFDNWQTKHPIGKLEKIIGAVNTPECFYEYQLSCKHLNIPIDTFKKKTMSTIFSICDYKKIDINNIIQHIASFHPYIQDRTTTEYQIFTIDPENSKDFDDGVSILSLPDNITQLSIYISNVPIILQSLGLLKYMSEKISTIYLPNRNCTMLPDLLCNNLCSLKENIVRIAFVMDLFIKNNEIIDIKYVNALIKVNKNYRYEENNLKQDVNYQKLFQLIIKLNEKNHYTIINDSHDVVTYLMILMNYHCANKLLEHNTGIFRNTILKDKKEQEIPSDLPMETYKFMKDWGTVVGQYIDGSFVTNNTLRHNTLQLNAYIHITSPIRRLVDLLNMFKFQEVFNMINTTVFTKDANEFYNKWINKLEYINKTMQSIRKVQTDCELLHKFNINPDILNNTYDGYLFDKFIVNEYLTEYNVYISDLKLIKKIVIRENYENYTCKKCKLYLFIDEDNLKKKIRVQFLT